MRTLGEILDRAQARNWYPHYMRIECRPEGDAELPDEGLPDEVEEEDEDE